MLRAEEGSLLLMGEGQQSLVLALLLVARELILVVGFNLAHHCISRPAFVLATGERRMYRGLWLWRSIISLWPNLASLDRELCSPLLGLPAYYLDHQSLACPDFDGFRVHQNEKGWGHKRGIYRPFSQRLYVRISFLSTSNTVRRCHSLSSAQKAQHLACGSGINGLSGHSSHDDSKS